jgi:hypothetical protein
MSKTAPTQSRPRAKPPRLNRLSPASTLPAPSPKVRSNRSNPNKPSFPSTASASFAKLKGGKRTISDLKRNVAGKVSQNQDFVKTTITRVSGGWLKLTPTEDLVPGEYALVEMKGSEGMNLYVWDFGVNPNGPANANPWKPDAKPAEPQKAKENL